MPETATPKKKKKRIKTSLVVMSRMDYEIVKRVFELLPQAGIDDEEFSFLLGKRNKYFFDLLNPTEKDKFKNDQLDVIPTILNINHRDLFPNDIAPGETVRLHKPSKTVYDDKIIYSHIVEKIDGSISKPIVWTKKIVKGIRKKENKDVRLEVLNLVETGYFFERRRALQIYLKIKKSIPDFSPIDLQKSLSILIRQIKGKRKALLVQEIKDGCYYFKPLDLV
ncbi:hypothetical protein [Desertivirga xinjiangensis]|uniref:hypothetical protein n=1 Tax=Desertivirga xinjiangensis TaxID=539206 RepID=UPI00210B3830|nr:hypothetical protein [Pedobacter xinjiangensis]